MKTTSLLYCIVFAVCANLFITPAAKAQVNTTDSLTLVDFYNSTDAPHWYTHTNWLTTKPVSTWYGVTVTNNRVTSLKLPINGLTGVIPSFIGNLDSLTYLNLQSNFLSGAIPSSIGNLQKLSFLNFAYCRLTGAIPMEVGNLTSLDSLLLYSNQLSGAIPSSIGNLVNLTYLNFADNQLTDTIPSSIGNLTNLTFLNINVNHLSGPIPATIGNLIKLKLLLLYYNQLSGAIPASIGNLVKLTELNLEDNQLSGTIPSSIGNLVKISYLSLNDNQLSGAIPTSLHKLKPSANVNLYSNKLTQFGDNASSIDTNYIHAIINSNLLTFDGLQAVAKYYPNVIYAPQDTILPIHQNGNVLSVSAGGTLNNNTYRWHQVGVDTIFIIKKDSTFTPSQSGQYYVAVRNRVVRNLTLYSDTINYVMPAAKQSNAFIAKAAQPSNVIKQMLVYPNPATNLIHLQTNGTAAIVLTNANGKVLLTKTINNSDLINVGKYANGIYYIQNKTSGEVQKIVVVH